MTPPAAAAAPRLRRAATVAPGRPLRSPRPRRVSGPARPPQRTRPTAPATAPQHEGGLALGLIAAFNRLTGHRLLDRLIAGRIWIALVAFALIGIVTLQLLLLTLNGNIGRSLEREALLQRENTAISIEDSEIAAGERVEARAAKLGMQLVPAGALRFLSGGHRGDIAHAAAALSAPVASSSGGEAETSVGAEGSSGAAGEATSAQGAEQGSASAEASAPASEASAPAQPSAAPEPQTAATQEPAAASAGAGEAAAEASPAGGTQASPAG